MKPLDAVAVAAFIFSTSVHAILDARASVIKGSFQLYAYGPNISGIPVYSLGGNVFIGDYKATNDSQAAPVIITPSGSGPNSGPWHGSPNTTDPVESGSPPTWSNLQLAVPAPKTTSHEVGLVTSSNKTSDVVTSGFTLYGGYVLVYISGKPVSLWYATKSADNTYALNWNYTDDETSDKVILSLRAVRPSNS